MPTCRRDVMRGHAARVRGHHGQPALHAGSPHWRWQHGGVHAAGVAALRAGLGMRLVLTSRTWLQVQRLYGEMRRLHPDMDTILLGGRDHLCLDNRICRAAGQDAGEACHKKCQGDGCRFHDGAANLSAAVRHAGSDGGKPVVDVEDLVAVGRATRSCTYYGGRHAIAAAQQSRQSCVICVTTTLVLNKRIAAAHGLQDFGAHAGRVLGPVFRLFFTLCT